MKRKLTRRAWAIGFAAGTLLSGFGLASAQDAQPAVKNSLALTGGLPRTSGSDSDAVTVRTILIRPKAAQPSLESPFFPSRDKLQRGAAAPIFLRQNFEATQAMKVLRETYQRGDVFKSLDDLDVAAVRAGTPLRLAELRRAAFREQAGWEYPLHEERPAFILLPDVQESRLYVQALVLGARADIKEGKLTDAADKICIATGLAKHIGETPFVVCRLVQKSHLDAALFAIEELLQHPAAANHYWSLAALPRPLISVLDVMQVESRMLAATYPELAKIDSHLTVAEWERMAGEVVELLRASDETLRLPKGGTPEANEMLQAWVRRSRERLPRLRPEWGERMAEMGDAEVGLRYWFERCREREKQHFAWAALEPSAALSRLAASEEALALDAADEPPVRLTTAPAATSLLRSSTLLEQRVGLLRTIEAIRDWSARHAGTLPPTLADLDLPIPRDPVTDAPFTYVRGEDGRTATLGGTPLDFSRPAAGGGKQAGKIGYRYELRRAD